MKQVFLLSIFIFLLSIQSFSQTVIWQETFDPSPAIGWNPNVAYGGVNGAIGNIWVTNDAEGGVAPGSCGTAFNGNQTMHITTSLASGLGAAYEAGGGFGCPGPVCAETFQMAQSPTISTVGQSNITLHFNYIENGDGILDNFSVYYSTNGGVSWTLLVDPPKTPITACAPQGTWTAFSQTLPASCNNISNLRLGFYWINNDDGLGTDPSVAIDSIQLKVPTITNNPPVAQNDNVSLPCNSFKFAVNVLSNDSDPNAGQTISIVQILQSPVHGTDSFAGNNIFYTPDNCYFGNDSLTYVIQDNFSPAAYDTAKIYFSVQNSCGCNTPPVAMPDLVNTTCAGAVVIHPLANDFDLDFGSILNLSAILSGPAHGSAVKVGDSIIYTPNTCYVGLDTIRYSVCDNAGTIACDDTLILINIQDCGCNIQPVANFDIENINCDVTTTFQPLLNDTDPDPGQTLNLAAIIYGPLHGTASLLLNGITYNPVACYSGVDTILYVVCDNHSTNSKCDTTAIFITIGACPCSPPVANFTANRTIICQGECINYTDLSTDTPTAWAWTFTGSSTPSSNLKDPQNICYPNAGFFQTSLTAVNQYGASTETKTSFIEVKPLPIVTISNDTAIAQGANIGLLATGGISYSWAPPFGLGNPNSAFTTFSGISSNTFTCTVTGTNGCSAQDSVTVIIQADSIPVKDDFYLTLPNAITPNFDNINNDFKAIYNGVAFFELHIFNRWGNEVFRTQDVDFKWNGSGKGSTAYSNEVFYYYARVRFLDGTEKNMKGDLTIIY